MPATVWAWTTRLAPAGFRSAVPPADPDSDPVTDADDPGPSVAAATVAPTVPLAVVVSGAFGLVVGEEDPVGVAGWGQGAGPAEGAGRAGGAGWVAVAGGVAGVGLGPGDGGTSATAPGWTSIPPVADWVPVTEPPVVDPLVAPAAVAADNRPFVCAPSEEPEAAAAPDATALTAGAAGTEGGGDVAGETAHAPDAVALA